MKIAVRSCEQTFSTRWIEYLEERGLTFDLVDPLAAGAVESLRGYDLLLWNWNLHDPGALKHAVGITRALEQAGVLVYPDTETAWHYDDKIAQTYLLEAMGAPLAKTHIFHDRDEADAWLGSRSEFPLVFKLSRGAGSYNVRLVKSRAEGRALVARMFGSGLVPTAGYLTDTATKMKRLRKPTDITDRLKRLPRAIRSIADRRKSMPRERDYVLFQEFLPGNEGDTRIVTVGDKAFGLRRMNRPNDFRASGSGVIDFDHAGIDRRFVEIALDISRRRGFQSMAYDFLYDADRAPALVEISYCFTPGETYRKCEGYWDRSLEFHPGHHYMEDVILDGLLDSLSASARA